MPALISRSLNIELNRSPETHPQLIGPSSQRRSVALQAAMPPFVGACFPRGRETAGTFIVDPIFNFLFSPNFSNLRP